MSETNHQQQKQLLDPSHHGQSSRSGRVKGAGGGGEIVEVEGGHIVRTIGRKDRHSKVCTAKGARDRRVRLSAQTAIQFYDVQDRLGYDRPSKALDWLIKKAKTAIDELAELPPWHPTTTNDQFHVQMEDSDEKSPAERVDSGKSPSSEFAFGGSTSFMPPSGFFFPIASSIAGHDGGNKMTNPAAASSSATNTGFYQYPPEHLSRPNNQAQDLRLSLQSFQDPTFLSQPQQPQQQSPLASDQSTLCWSDHIQRILHWSNDSGDGAYMSNQMLGQRSNFYTQRGPLQSNNSPSFVPWSDPAATVMTSGIMSDFRILERIQGEEEQNDRIPRKHQSPSAPGR